MKIKDEVAVVTGAGSGIGRAVAIALAQQGAHLALADRDRASLEQTKAAIATQANIYELDVSDASAVEAFALAVTRDFGRLSIVVNNAGVAMIGNFADVTLAEMEWVHNINFWGVVYCCKFLLPLLRQAPQAHIVNMCSLSALLGLQGQTHYSASKFAVRGFTEALQQELHETKIRMTSVYPAGVRTGLVNNARVAAGADQADAEEIKKLFSHLNVISPDQAAQRIVSAILHGKSRLMIGSHARGLDTVQRLFPASAGSIITGMLRRLS